MAADRSKNTGTNTRDAGELERTLDGAVFTERSVQNRERDIDACIADRKCTAVNRHEAAMLAVGRQRHLLTRCFDFRKSVPDFDET